MKKNVHGYMGLKYVHLSKVPMDVSEKFGEGIHADVMKRCEKLVAERIIRSLPIRGMEVKFFRSIFAMSQRQFGEQFGYSDVAILKWERTSQRRLAQVNELAVRVFVASKLEISMLPKDFYLPVDVKTPKILELNFEKDGADKKEAA